MWCVVVYVWGLVCVHVGFSVCVHGGLVCMCVYMCGVQCMRLYMCTVLLTANE